MTVKLSRNAQFILSQRYLLKDEDGEVVETPTKLFRRVAKTVANVELNYGKTKQETKQLEKEFFNIIKKLEFLPNSPALFNSGTELSQLFACFALPVDDSLDGIFMGVYKSAKIFQTGGGVGYNFSNLRPKDDKVKTTQGVASGPLTFMNVYNEMCETIKQGSKRRGAMMGILNVNHPQIMDFIVAKEYEFSTVNCPNCGAKNTVSKKILSNFNLSVGLDEKFMKALETDGDYSLINPRTKRVAQRIKARAIWNTLVTMSWKNGEPAVLFFDNINKTNPTPELGRLEITNPCSELPLLPYESCVLGSINLSKFIKLNGKTKFDYEKLRKVVRLTVRFLDNMIDANKFPFDEIREVTLGNRKIGLGVMGWADALILLGIQYDSDEAVSLARQIMKFISGEGKQMSRELGKEKGNFPNKDKSIYKNEEYMRNATITSIAPTGTISIIADCSQSIEPVFALVQKRNVEESLGKTLLEINRAVKLLMIKRNLWNPETEEKLSSGSCIIIPKEIRKLVPTANDIAPEWHVKMQATFQEFVDNAVSKTCNLPNNTTIDDVEKIYLMAHRLGCKGITIYRDGSRKHQLLESNDGKCPTCS